MTKEENEAIERLDKANNDIWFSTLYSQEEQDEDIKITLNLIQKQQEEIEKLNKDNKELDKQVQEYFEKKVEDK